MEPVKGVRALASDPGHYARSSMRDMKSAISTDSNARFKAKFSGYRESCTAYGEYPLIEGVRVRAT